MANLISITPQGNKKLVEVDLNSLQANNLIPDVTCDSSVYVGSAVIMDGSGVAFNAIATDISTTNVIGVIESKSDSTTCVIRVGGVTASLFTGLDTTKIYYLSTTVAGEVTTTVPTTAGHVKLKLGQPFSSSQFLVLKGEPTIRR